MAITDCRELKEDLDSIQILEKKLQENKKFVGRGREGEREPQGEAMCRRLIDMFGNSILFYSLLKKVTFEMEYSFFLLLYSFFPSNFVRPFARIDLKTHTNKQRLIHSLLFVKGSKNQRETKCAREAVSWKFVS